MMVVHKKLQAQGAARLCLVAAILALTPPDVAAQDPFARANDVAFSIRIAQKNYAIGDKIVISYTIKNVGNGPLFVPRGQWDTACTGAPHLWALLEDSAGRHYEPGFIGGGLGAKECASLTVSEWLKKDAVLLKPQQSASGTFIFQFPAGRSFTRKLKPGLYRLEALLYGWNTPFTASQRKEMDTVPSSLLIGETNATAQIELTAPQH